MNNATSIRVEVVPTFCGQTIRELRSNIKGLPIAQQNQLAAAKIGIDAIAKGAGLLGNAALTLAFYEAMENMSQDMAEEVLGD